MVSFMVNFHGKCLIISSLIKLLIVSGPDLVMPVMGILRTQTPTYDGNCLIECQGNYIFVMRICQGKLTTPL